jgi:hypothetical protein
MRETDGCEQALRWPIRFRGFQKGAGRAMFLQQAKPSQQERSAQPPMCQFGTNADDANRTNQAFTLLVCDPLELALTKRRKSSSLLNRDQVELALIGA